MKQLKLSEAIREGCKYGPQYTNGCMLDGNGGSCALGSAYQGMAGRVVAYDEHYSLEPFSLELQKASRPCPCGGREEIACAVMHLNTHHKWSREAIAEWVETVERKLGLWDEVPKVEMAKQETRTEYEVKPREYSFK